MAIEAYVVIAALVGFALLAWWAKRQGNEVQKALDEAVAAHELDQLKEKSNARAEVADSRSDPRIHDVPDIVPASRVPGWIKRD